MGKGWERVTGRKEEIESEVGKAAMGKCMKMVERGRRKIEG